jgi:hypothetical protein
MFFFPTEVLQELLHNMQYVKVTEQIKWCLNLCPAIALAKKIHLSSTLSTSCVKMTQMFFAVNIHAQTKGITMAYGTRKFAAFFGSPIKPPISLMDIEQNNF